MIQKLSAELLHKIFKELDSPDLLQCQQVCRTWYRPAHLGFLQQVNLHGAHSIERFLTSLAHNPDPSYFKAVKRIIIFHPLDCLFERGHIEDLVTKFPSLNMLNIFADPQAFQVFDDEICDALLQTCPKVNVFADTREADPFEVRDAMLRLRRVLTGLSMGDVEEAFTDYHSALQFVVSFPRLQEFRGGLDYFLLFQEYLPVFEQLPNLTKIFMYQAQDEENFMERYLSRKTTKERDIILKRLARVYRLELQHHREENCANSWKFMLKYMTGLQHLVMAGEFDSTEWRVLDAQILTNTDLSLLHTTNYKSGRRARFTATKVTHPLRCLPNIFHGMLNCKEEPEKSALVVRVLRPSTQQRAVMFVLIELIVMPADNLIIMLDDPATGLELFRRLTLLKDVDLFRLYDNLDVSYETGNYNEMLEKLDQTLIN